MEFLTTFFILLFTALTLALAGAIVLHIIINAKKSYEPSRGKTLAWYFTALTAAYSAQLLLRLFFKEAQPGWLQFAIIAGSASLAVMHFIKARRTDHGEKSP